MKAGKSADAKEGGRGKKKPPAAKSTQGVSGTDKHAGETTTALAAQAGVSRYKVEQAAAVQKADPEAAKDVLAGKSTLREAAKKAKVPRLSFGVAHPKMGEATAPPEAHRRAVGLPRPGFFGLSGVRCQR